MVFNKVFIYKHYLLLIMLLGLLFRMLVAIPVLQNTQLGWHGDSYFYFDISQSIINTGSYPDAFRTPIYPFFLAIFKNIIQYVYLMQILLDTLVIFIMYKMAHIVFGLKEARIASFLYSINPCLIIYSSLLMSESLFIFVFFLAFYVLIKALYSGRFSLFFVSGFIFSIGVLIKPFIIYLYIPVSLLLLFNDKFSKIKRLLAVILFTFFYLSLPMLWSLRNYNKYGTFILSTQGIGNVFVDLAANTLCVKYNLSNKEEADEYLCNYLIRNRINISEPKNFQFDIWYNPKISIKACSIGKGIIIENPGYFLQAVFLGQVRRLFPTGFLFSVLRFTGKKADISPAFKLYDSRWARFLKNTAVNYPLLLIWIMYIIVTFVFIRALCVLALIKFFYKDRAGLLSNLLLMVVILYIFLIPVTWLETRQSLAAEPFLILFAANGLRKIYWGN